MKFSEKDINNHTLIQAKTLEPCSICKEQTEYIDYCYETRCCSTECLEVLDNTFNDYIDKIEHEEEADIKMCSECEFELGQYEYKGKLYCSECLLNQLEKEEKIETWSVQHYMVDSEYYGNDNENDMEEVTDDIAKRFKIKKIEI